MVSTVEVDYTEPDIEYTLVGIAGGNDPDTGDIYRGLDHFGRVKDSYWYDYGSSSDVDRIKYGYDRNGSRLYRENTVATANNAYFDEKYLYDLIDRLKHMDRGRLTAQKDGVTDKTFAQCWTLDATGNWRKFLEDSDGDGSWSLDQTRTANKVNEITDLTESIGPSWVTPAYSRAGNMTTIPKPADPIVGYTGTYDAWNRLVRIEEGANKVAEYEYDGAKRRTLKKTYVSGILDQMRHFYYTEPSKWQIVEERVESSSDAERRFVWGLRYVDDLILRDRDTDADATFDERLYGMQDANWNVTSLKDTGGAVQERYAYSGYGEPVVLTPSFGSRTVSSFDWELRFAGYRFDSESGLYYVRNRICHSAVSWFQRDPLGLSAGVNPYQYVHGRPLVLTDASGRDICDCCNFAVQEERKRFPGNQIESRSGRRRCRLIISCERGCRAGRTPFPATTTVDAGGTIRICIDCRLGNVNIAATIIHELEHARDYCDTPRPTIDLPTCIQWETNACRAQCAFYQGGPNSIDDPAAYQRCIDCCVYFSCKHHGAPAPVPECQEFQVPTKPCFKWIPGRGFEYDPSDPRCPASHRR